MLTNWLNKSDFLFILNKTMPRTISDSERLTQMTLNRKYMELEDKEREIKQLRRLLAAKEIQINEYKNSIKILCNQVHDLTFNHCNHA